SREADPDQLSSLFKLDHLATRMRRNGENLLVLAGEEPGRRWTRPVPLVDVLRAAASEVEQYERIELNSVPATEVAGRVVNDLVHLLAELLENATSFSSPQTKVKVTGHALPDGRVLVEIHDTGIGLSPEDLSAINERLASPPTVDVSVSRRMGLFVVGRLSLRHGIRIQLRPSDSGGTTALVMLPVDVAQGGAQAPQPGKGKPAGGGPAMPKGTGLAAALQRGPSGGPGGGGAAKLGAPARQVGGGEARPELPGSGVPVGAGSGDGGAPTTNLFGDSGTGSGKGRHGPPAAPPVSRQTPPLPQRSGPAGQLTGGSPNAGGQSGPGDTAEFTRPDDWGNTWDNQSTGEYAAPQPGSDTGEYARPQSASDTGQFARPQSASDTGEFPRPQAGGPSDTSQFVRPDEWNQPRPSWASATGPGADGPRGHDDSDVNDTGEFARPGYTGASSGGQGAAPDRDRQGQGPQDTGEFALPGDRPQAEQAPSYDPDFGIPAVPPAAADAPTPIFESIESNWFRAASSAPPPQAPPRAEPSERTQEPAQSSYQAPAPRPGGQPASAVPPMPQRQPARGTAESAPSHNSTHSTGEAQRGADPGAHWGASPNDERWRRAEQVRQPAAGGVTTSGLPRRVPRANLVAGTAQQQSSAQSGPQVSRAPDDVRGRLTNLRRGIQQGRQAGTTNGRGIGPTYQQER
ncbi:MAG TPA: ATP-binding protein, partial [Streptomyces sp.]|nr:ATP-binding protein [Streptomyces sp.]